MSGDVQPRKRKDKKRKKDDLGLEEPRGTAAPLGEGDVFLHSHHDHGTGGHWCAKIIFFSLLAILITLIGLIILENRGLSELEANSVESRYSGVLEGWIEDAPDDDHHDAHTLDLKHNDNDEDDHDDEVGHGGDDDEDDEQDLEDQRDDDDHDDEDDEHEQDDNDEERDDDDEENEDDDANRDEEDDDDDRSIEPAEDEDDETHEDEGEEEDTEIEVERIEKEASEEEPISLELPALPEDDDDDDDSRAKEQDDDNDQEDDKDNDNDGVDDNDDDDFLEADDVPLVVARVTAPAGKPFVEVEEDESSEKPPDTLEEEEEYEKQQEELRKEEEQASHMWLKLSVGGALLVATHAVMRRATGPRDIPETEEHVAREETPLADRRMTLIREESLEHVTGNIQDTPKPLVKEVAKKVSAVVQSSPKQEEEDGEQYEVEESEEEEKEEPQKDQELYSGDEDEPEDEEEEIVEEKKEIPKPSAPVFKKPEPEPEPDEDVPDDVEIIDDEQLEEELEEEDEEEISDVDDAELLTRLEAKYGRMPEPERPGQKHKDGGNSIEDEWPGEPSDSYWRQQLDSLEQELRQEDNWLSTAERASVPELADSARARYIAAAALDRAAEAKRDNRLLSRSITAYLHLLKMNEHLSDKKLIEIANRTLDRMQFRGNYLNAEPVYRLLIRRFPDDPSYRNNLSISFLMANRGDLAEEVLKETLRLWPKDRVALAHYGFVLKTQHNQLEKAIELLNKALEGDKGPACEPRFYFHLGDALLLLGRYPEAHEVHKRGAKLGHFLSPSQRSLYNVPRLKSQPWWNVDNTPYSKLARALEKSWKEILKEGEAARALYEQEKEGLKERGEWSQLDLFVRGREIPDRCKRAPVTCSIVRSEPAAVGCRRGQIKFSAMEAGTHVRPHVGPTNCRLRMHLGLSNTKDTYLRVDQETRQWREGKVLVFDDSFEHEVWHNGTGKRLVLIVDVWHPDLTPTERRQLSAI